jgi:hypothetical protein
LGRDVWVPWYRAGGTVVPALSQMFSRPPSLTVRSDWGAPRRAGKPGTPDKTACPRDSFDLVRDSLAELRAGADLVVILRERTGIPTLGVVPWLKLHLPDEDAASLGNRPFVGSELIAQGFASAPYFHPRPSARRARTFGLLGEPRVNVLLLNLDLNRELGKPRPAAATRR